MTVILAPRQRTRGVLASGIAPSDTVGGGDSGGGGIALPPTMPTTAHDSTWGSPQWSTSFPKTVAAGGFLGATAYGGAASASDAGKGQFAAYTYSAYHDTRSKHTYPGGAAGEYEKQTLSGCVTNSTTTVQVASGAFPARWNGRTIFGPGIPDLTTATFVDATHILLSNAATASATVTLFLSEDYGFYDERYISVTDAGILQCPLFTTAADGRHHSVGLHPKLNGDNSGRTDVLGGRFTICMRSDLMVGYKVVPLLWPQTNTSKTGGELDQPEYNCTGVAAGGFAHYDDNSGQYSKGTANGGASNAFVVPSDNAWHVFSQHWRPNQTTPSLSNIQFWDDGVKTLDRTGANVPHQSAMHWIWQFETNISDYSTPITPLTSGNVYVAWATYEPMI